MRLKLISEIARGLAFHYFGKPERVFVKVDDHKALTPEKTFKKVSQSTLVVPHEGRKYEK